MDIGYPSNFQAKLCWVDGSTLSIAEVALQGDKWHLSWSSVISLLLLLAGRGHLFVFLVMVE